VTLKMRLGWDERSIVAPELARSAEAAGIAMVTVHGRTRSQFYQGKADWSAIAAVKAAVKIPVVANGDLTNFEDGLEMLAASHADAVMVGRSARGRPWFPGQVGEFFATGKKIADPALAVQRDILLELYDAWLGHSGRARGMREARKHIGWALEAAAASFGRSATWAKGWRASLLNESDSAAVARGITNAFDDLGWRAAA
jgi:tRNA-dihydrouridine synthase B